MYALELKCLKEFVDVSKSGRADCYQQTPDDMLLPLHMGRRYYTVVPNGTRTGLVKPSGPCHVIDCNSCEDLKSYFYLIFW